MRIVAAKRAERRFPDYFKPLLTISRARTIVTGQGTNGGEGILAEAAALDDARAIPVEHLAALLGATRIEPVPIPHDCTDGFAVAYWRRPEAYLNPVVRGGISMPAQTGEEAIAPGLADDRSSGRWDMPVRENLIRAKVAELTAAGATAVREEFYGEYLGHVVMLDPERNEFCVA
jgi:Glyoxalase-like domain